jgi:hypothetical protein
MEFQTSFVFFASTILFLLAIKDFYFAFIAVGLAKSAINNSIRPSAILMPGKLLFFFIGKARSQRSACHTISFAPYSFKSDLSQP